MMAPNRQKSNPEPTGQNLLMNNAPFFNSVLSKYFRAVWLVGCFMFLVCFNSGLQAQISGAPGAFARMGISPKGMSLGNATSASVSKELLHPYHNPALLGFTTSIRVGASFSSLSLDRSLNSISAYGPIGPDAGLGFSWIHAGVDNIDGRDSDGAHTKIYSTSENLLLLSFAKNFGPSLSLGLSLKAYQASLFEEVPSSFSIGFDLGLIKTFELPKSVLLGVAIVIKDINAKYEWDTTPIYDESGSVLTDNVPRSYNLGLMVSKSRFLGLNQLAWFGELSYQTVTMEGLQSYIQLIDGLPQEVTETVELNRSQTFLRLGLLVQPVADISLHVGADQLGIRGWNFGEIVRPSVGFSVKIPVENMQVGFNYAYTLEPVGGLGINSLALTLRL
jgi:hypothetical protein